MSARLVLSSLAFALVLAGCGSSTESAKPEAAGKAAAKGEGKKKTPKPPPAGPPVLRSARFAIPLTGAIDAAALRGKVVEAWNKAGKADGAPVPDPAETPKPLKCRHATVFGTTGVESAELRVFERLDKEDCKAADAKEESWEVVLRLSSAERPAGRDKGGALNFLLAAEDHDRDGAAWKTSYGAVYQFEAPPNAKSGFDKDTAWLQTQLPGDLKLDAAKTATLDGWRWKLGTFTVDGEKLEIELERWDCADGKTAGAEIVFRTAKRSAGAEGANKDVTVSEKTQAFADALAASLGSAVGGSGTTVAAGLTCAAK
jgi:hypothetical protein